MLSPLQYWIVLLAVSAYAFACGRREERAAAMVCIAATIGSVLLNSPLADRFSNVELGILAVDVLALAAFTAIALRTDRYWPLWVAAFQLTTLLAHLLKGLQLDLMPQAYAAAARFWVYPIFVTIVVGTWRARHPPRYRREGPLAA